MNIAITGGIGCGKSTVGKCFKKLGAAVYNADEICHEAIEYSHIKEQLSARWGNKILNSDSSVNRREVAKIVFNNESELDFLTGIIYNELFKILDEKILDSAMQWKFFEIPLLYEENLAYRFDRVISVWAPHELVLRRTANWPDGELERRSARQWAPERKLECADFGIVNAGGIDELELQCSRLALLLGMNSL